MSIPSIMMRPLSGISNPAIIRSKVVLPQPEGPSSAKKAPRSILSETPATAVVAPKRFETPAISSSVIRRAPNPPAQGGTTPCAAWFLQLDQTAGEGRVVAHRARNIGAHLLRAAIVLMARIGRVPHIVVVDLGAIEDAKPRRREQS